MMNPKKRKYDVVVQDNNDEKHAVVSSSSSSQSEQLQSWIVRNERSFITSFNFLLLNSHTFMRDIVTRVAQEAKDLHMLIVVMSFLSLTDGFLATALTCTTWFHAIIKGGFAMFNHLTQRIIVDPYQHYQQSPHSLQSNSRNIFTRGYCPTLHIKIKTAHNSIEINQAALELCTNLMSKQKMLRELFLWENDAIYEIPTIYQYLANDEVDDDDDDFIFDVVKPFTQAIHQLVTLSITGASIYGYDDFQFPRTLRCLHLINNNYMLDTDVWDAICKCTCLTELLIFEYVNTDVLNDIEIKLKKKTLLQTKNLTNLRLFAFHFHRLNNQIDFDSLVDALSSIKSLQFISLYDLVEEDDEREFVLPRHLEKLLKGCNELRYLFLQFNNQLDDGDMKSLFETPNTLLYFNITNTIVTKATLYNLLENANNFACLEYFHIGIDESVEGVEFSIDEKQYITAILISLPSLLYNFSFNLVMGPLEELVQYTSYQTYWKPACFYDLFRYVNDLVLFRMNIFELESSCHNYYYVLKMFWKDPSRPISIYDRQVYNATA